jgi:two-component system, OmpR family, sensor kinase
VAIKNIETSHLVHDLKNPVNIIESGARTLLEKQDRYGELTERQLKVVRRMLRSALKLRALADNMLEVDMASKGITKYMECNMADIIRRSLLEVLDVIDPSISEKIDETQDIGAIKEVLANYHIFIECDDTQVTKAVLLDETKMGLIVTNLLTNAFKYKQQSVRLKCDVDGDNITISVKDDGPGIPESYHKQIFDQYFQCIPTDGFPVRGHGLGLAGAQALTEALGGQLYLCKTDKGAEFVVTVKTADEC